MPINHEQLTINHEQLGTSQDESSQKDIQSRNACQVTNSHVKKLFLFLEFTRIVKSIIYFYFAVTKSILFTSQGTEIGGQAIKSQEILLCPVKSRNNNSLAGHPRQNFVKSLDFTSQGTRLEEILVFLLLFLLVLLVVFLENTKS